MLTIVEKQSMVQEVVASAEVFQSGLKASGHVEVPGIFFDTGKSELKPESDAAVGEVAKLLNADPSLKVYVVGHTDNVASLELNTKLSQVRAEAVVQALVTKHAPGAAPHTDPYQLIRYGINEETYSSSLLPVVSMMQATDCSGHLIGE